MGTLIVVTGGSRSGKSEFAENLARQRSKKTVYIATAVADDEEMKARVARHQKRRPKEWQTVEAACDLPTIMAQAACKYETVLIDSLTTYAASFLYARRHDELQDTENAAIQEMYSLAKAVKTNGATVIIVTDEVGSGIVPDNAVSRAFRDVLGSMNSVLAAEADRVYLSVAGLTIDLKKIAVKAEEEICSPF